MNTYSTLEFDKILVQLSDCAMSENVKTRCLDLQPSLNETEARRWMDETTQAKTIIETIGTPPLPTMENLHKALGLIAVDAMLLPEQIAHVLSFLVACRRMVQYLKKAETSGIAVAFYGGSLDERSDLAGEIDRCIKNGIVDDRASPALSVIRRQMSNARAQMKLKLESLLKKNRDWFSESFVSVRNGRYTLPVKREFKNSVIVYPSKEVGLVYQRANAVGELGVQIKGVKKLINHKRVKLHVPACELCPEDYDFSIVFDTVANRKSRHILDKRHEEGNVVIITEGEERL